MLSLAYILYSAVKLRLINQNKGTNLLSTSLYRTHSIYDFFKLRSVKKKSVSTDDRVQCHVVRMNSDLLNDELVKFCLCLFVSSSTWERSWRDSDSISVNKLIALKTSLLVNSSPSICSWGRRVPVMVALGSWLWYLGITGFMEEGPD